MVVESHQPKLGLRDGGPTVWGLTAMQIGQVLWTSYGVDCVELGSSQPPQAGADLYLLELPGERMLFDLPSLHRRLLWNGATVTVVQIEDEAAPDFQESVVSDAGGVRCIRRTYGRERRILSTAWLTTSSDVASTWSQCRTRQEFESHARGMEWITDMVASPGVLLKRGVSSIAEQHAFISRVVRTVPHPDRIVRGVERLSNAGVYGAAGQSLHENDFCLGAVWLGERGQADPPEAAVAVGPAFIPDAVVRPSAQIRPIAEIFSPESQSRAERVSFEHSGYTIAKRLFDVVFSLVVLVAISPVLLLTCILIGIEDGIPVHYFQWRESLGGREFRCWKLRSMRRNAESMVADLQALNRSDGPQVFIENDPRVTRVGRIIRKLQIDEFPQFFNVLLGDMSVVGPRPSPRKENQFCPAWRETRLSVRPGVTGLWQVMRTRAPGKDFQEWIRYDTEYVERMGFFLDMWIIWRTVINLVTGGRKAGQGT